MSTNHELQNKKDSLFLLNLGLKEEPESRPHFSDSCMFSTEDLWDCLEQASGKPIAAVMGSWTKQMGFPIIVVDQEQVSSSLSYRTDYENKCF